MDKKVIIGLLLLDVTCPVETGESSTITSHTLVNVRHEKETPGKVLSQNITSNISTAEEELEEGVTPVNQVPTKEETGTRRQQLMHLLSEPVIIVIILGVLFGIIGTILLIAYGIGRLRKKSLPEVQPSLSNEESAPLSSVAIGNSEM